MVEFQVINKIPVLTSDLSVAIQKIEQIMLSSVQLNIMMGGRPDAFKTKGNNSTPLVGTGRMYKGIKSAHTVDSATVFVDSSVVSKTGFFYPKSLNDGASVPEVDGKLMVFEIDGHTVFTYHRKAYHRNAFPFMLFQAEDKIRIMEALAGAIFQTKQVSFS